MAKLKRKIVRAPMPAPRQQHQRKENYRNTTEETDGKNHWNTLPQEVMVNIFDYLPQSDLFRLATVCRSWRDLIHTTPHFWRTMHLKLSCAHKSLHSKRTLCLSNILGGHFKELWISCLHQHANAGCKSMANDFRKFLLNLQHPSLTSIKIVDLQLQGALLTTVSGIRQVMMRMLSGLDRLHCFQMSSAQWPLHEGIKVMDTVLTVSRGTLQSLVIDGFFEATSLAQRPAEFERVTNGILSLNRLTKLGIDYQLLTDSFVTALSRSHTGQLKVLKIVASKLENNTPLIKERAWLCLTKACPAMKVAYTVDGMPSFMAIYNALDPCLPIYKIRLLLAEKPQSLELDDFTVAVVLSLFMVSFWRRLVKFEMDIASKSELIDLTFLMLVTQCEKLLYVKTSANFHYPDTLSVAERLIQQRKRQHDETQCVETPCKRAKTNPRL
ncbi:F-box only protein 39-like [Physella acuta]|uniref:F-box only protein 39-like n=1 Tax=Physella acuta TaxID=109671 RepID=UPI0027DD5757|nr:F-box only protein 39-like [Physella acuta]